MDLNNCVNSISIAVTSILSVVKLESYERKRFLQLLQTSLHCKTASEGNRERMSNMISLGKRSTIPLLLFFFSILIVYGLPKIGTISSPLDFGEGGQELVSTNQPSKGF